MTQHIHLLSSARCGSSYMFYTLREYINPRQAPTVESRIMFSEPFSEHLNEDNFPGIDVIKPRVKFLETTDQPHVIKNHMRHLNWLQFNRPDMHRRFVSLPLHTIVLIRRNLFETTLSWCISETTKQHARYDEAPMGFEIDPEWLRKSLRSRVQMMNDIARNKHRFNYNEIVYYEDLTFNPRADYLLRGLCRTHADVIPERTITHFVDRAPSKREQLTNYDQLYETALRELRLLNLKPIASHIDIAGVQITNIDFQNLS